MLVIISFQHQDQQVQNFSQECVFEEKMHKHFYYTYCSYSFPRRKLRKDGTQRRSKRRWCLGINRNGTLRLGKRTKNTHSFAQFTPRPINDPVTPFPPPALETSRPVSKVTPTPQNPTESPSTKRTKRPTTRPTRRPTKRPTGCNGPGLFNLKCRDDGDVITTVSQIRRKPSRRRSRGRSRSSRKRRKDRRRKSSRIDTIGLFTG